MTTPHCELYVFVMSTVTITGSATLRELDVSWNDISDDGHKILQL